MDDEAESDLVALALIEAQLANSRASRNRLCLRLQALGANSGPDARDLRRRIASVEAEIVSGRQRRAEVLERVNQVDSNQHVDLLGQVA